METVLGFYRDLLGMTVVADETLSGEQLEATVGIPGARIRVVELSFGSGTPFIELLQYLAPVGNRVEARACDPGTGHVAFLVEDLDSVHRRLSDAGVNFMGSPAEITGGYFKGDRTVYCEDPEGWLVELWQAQSPISSNRVNVDNRPGTES